MLSIGKDVEDEASVEEKDAKSAEGETSGTHEAGSSEPVAPLTPAASGLGGPSVGAAGGGQTFGAPTAFGGAVGAGFGAGAGAVLGDAGKGAVGEGEVDSREEEAKKAMTDVEEQTEEEQNAEFIRFKVLSLLHSVCKWSTAVKSLCNPRPIASLVRVLKFGTPRLQLLVIRVLRRVLPMLEDLSVVDAAMSQVFAEEKAHLETVLSSMPSTCGSTFILFCLYHTGVARCSWLSC